MFDSEECCPSFIFQTSDSHRVITGAVVKKDCLDG